MNTSKISIVHAAIASTCALLVAACGAAPAGGDGTGQSSAAESNDSQSMANANTDNTVDPQTDGDAGADGGYFSCQMENECVAVELIDHCCYNGWKVAVASSEAAAYQRAEECPPDTRHLCPEYVVLDKRVPVCNTTTRTCEMVTPKIPIEPVGPVMPSKE